MVARYLKLDVDALAGQRIMSVAQLIAATMDAKKSLYESLADWLSFLGVEIRAALTLGIRSENDSNGWQGSVDPDFEGWIHGDPLVTGNAAGRYCDDAPGYLTRNGLGSLEIGAADD